MESVQKQLEELGLSANEVKVYLASLEVGAATAQQIAAKAAVPRPTTYVAIGGLVKRGLMSSHTRGKKQYFQAERPEVLMSMLETEKKRVVANEARLKALLPRLHALISVSGSRPDISHFEGIEGLRTMRAVLFGTKATELLVVGSPERYEEVIGKDEGVVHSFHLTKSKVQLKQIVLHTGRRPEMTVSSGKYRYIKTEELESGELAIFGDFIALIAYLDAPQGFLVKSKELARVARIMFGAAWKGAGA